MQGQIHITQADTLKIHTFTAPERGWRVNSHIEFSSQLLVVDAQYLLPYAREVVGYAGGLKKPISRLYISHYHPDHLLGAVAFSAPTYALREVSAKIEAVGDRVAREEHEKFGQDVPERAQRPSHVVEPRTESIESIPIEFIHLQHAETRDALMIAFPAHGILITQDLVYNRVHVMGGEKALSHGRTGSRRPRTRATTRFSLATAPVGEKSFTAICGIISRLLLTYTREPKTGRT